MLPPFHEVIADHAILQAFGIDRFLKLYHLVELSFDYHLVKQIRALGPDLKGVGKVLNSHSRKELELLNNIFTQYTTDHNRIAEKMNLATRSQRFINLTMEILFDFGKESNPVSEKEAEIRLILESTGFTFGNCSSNLNFGSNASVQQNKYQKFIIDFSCYWIYRVRCSVAHQRIGEYLLTSSDEDYIVEVVEPIIQEILSQIFTRIT